MDVTLFCHPWEMDNWSGRMEKYWLPWLVGMPAETAQAICCVIMGGVLENFPRLRFVFAHGGGAYPQIAGRVAHGFRMRPDLCATNCKINPDEFKGRFWTDSHVNTSDAFRLLVATVGVDKVCLGTDYPFPLGELEPGKIVDEYPDFDSEQKDKVLWKNSVDLLKLDENQLFQ